MRLLHLTTFLVLFWAFSAQDLPADPYEQKANFIEYFKLSYEYYDNQTYSTTGVV